MLTIDGSQGEGGGQVLRSALALSLVTGRPFRIERIRAGRKKPGLSRQHLTAVNAAAELGQANVTGAALRSTELTFEPGPVRPGEYRFAVGTAGSATLVLQTVLPALLVASESSRLRLEGGTHNPWAPPFDFLARAFLPLVNRMGPTVDAVLVRHGFYPAGGGALDVTVTPAPLLQPLTLLDRDNVRRISATAKVSRLPMKIADRELEVIASALDLPPTDLRAERVSDSLGPGNVVSIEVECDHFTEVFTGFGQKGLPAETVAQRAVEQTQRYLASNAAAGEYLADQLLIPLALARGGAFSTMELSSHARTNIDVVQTFLDVRFDIKQQSEREWIIRASA